MSVSQYKQWQIYHCDVVDSTMEKLKVVRNSVGQKIVVIANRQEKGRGRNGKEWYSPPGNLYLSFSFPHSKKIELTDYVFIMGLVISKSIIRISNKSIIPNIKWPNDILINKKKISGILIETNSTGTIINSIIVGVGMNLFSNPIDTPYGTTNFYKETKLKIDIYNLSKIILDEFEHWYQILEIKGFDFIRKEWLKYSIKIGSKITLNLYGSKCSVEGIYRGIDLTGALLIEFKNGKVKKFLSAEIIMEKKIE